jgi:hypothetical protein
MPVASAMLRVVTVELAAEVSQEVGSTLSVYPWSTESIRSIKSENVLIG